jgi:hypothetical protein
VNLVLVPLIVRERSGVFSGLGIKADGAATSDHAKKIDWTGFCQPHLPRRTNSLRMDTLNVGQLAAAVHIVGLFKLFLKLLAIGFPALASSTASRCARASTRKRHGVLLHDSKTSAGAVSAARTIDMV